jgi:Tol biopolymer transport system component
MKTLLATLPVVLALAWFVALPGVPAAPPAVTPVNLAVNTAADEDEPFVAADDRTLYYAANAKGKWDIMFATRKKVADPWGKGEVLQDYIQTEGDDRGACVTAPGRFPQYLYFATTSEKGGKSFDLCVAVKQGADKAFTEPRALAALDSEADEMHPWLSANGKELYFSRKTADGWRVYVSRRKQAAGPNGFGPPEALDELAPDFHHATLTPDGHTMYLQGPLEKGRWGVFVSFLSGKTWGKPEPLDELNDPKAPTGDRSPSLSRDGNRLYFASDRPDRSAKGGLDLWMVHVSALRRR